MKKSAAAVLFSLGVAMPFLGSSVGAQTTAIRVLSSNGMKGVIEAIAPQAERAAGRPLSVDFSTAATLKQRIASGEAFDVAVLTTEVIDDLIKAGTLSASSRVNLARSGIGIGVREGTATADVGTPDAVKQLLLRSMSVAFTRDGATRPAIDKMLGRLGIATALAPRILLTPAGQAPEMVAKGEAEIVLTLISEIVTVPGVRLLGPLPAADQSYVSFAGATGVQAKDAAAAKKLLAFLSGSAVAMTLQAKGMERLP